MDNLGSKANKSLPESAISTDSLHRSSVVLCVFVCGFRLPNDRLDAMCVQLYVYICVGGLLMARYSL